MKKMSEHVTPAASCPNCGKKLDRATNPIDEHGPRPGDMTVCVGCGAMLRFAAGMRLRLAGKKHLQELSDGAREMLLRIQGLILIRNKQRKR